jgi:hypothetical protein
MSFATLRRLLLHGISLIAGGLLLTAPLGCASSGSVTSPGGVAYQHGTLVTQESVGMDGAWDACLGAVKRLEFEEESSAKDALEATLVARSATDRRITFNLRRVSDKVTEVRIRVGLFGDERFAREVHEAFRKAL